MMDFWLYVMDHSNFSIAQVLYHMTLSLSRGSKVTPHMNFFTPICLFTMPLLCIYDDNLEVFSGEHPQF